MKVQVKKDKNDEHIKAHVLKKRWKIAMFQNKKLERDHTYKRSIVLVYLFPHTCTSWSKSMSLLSMDPWFDFTTCAIQVCYFAYPYLKLHINLLEVGENKRRQKHCYALVRKYTPLSDLRVPFEEYKVNYAFAWENFQDSKLLRCEIGKRTLFQELFHFSTTQGNMLANTTYPTCVKNVLE